MSRSTRIVYLALALVLAAGALLAQGTGTTSSLSGTVTSGGKPLPGVTVTVSSPALQGTRTAVTGEAGGYNFPALPPGAYNVAFELEGMNKVTKKTQLSLAQPSHIDADLKVSGMSEAITVTASAPAVLETTEVSRNFSQKQISELPVRRNVTDTVLLAPGTNNNGPNQQITISGGPSFDNLFLVNGVVVNENLRGQPHNLFIEDAIQETTVVTGTISAEYGRFTGGVVSAITKSGGNEYSGSLRDSLTNPNWIAKTQFPGEADHPDKISSVYEGTLGGYLMKDRLWFFGAGRHTKGAPANGFNAAQSTLSATNFSGLPFLNTINENRYEGKITGQITPKHNLVGSYLNVKRTELNNFFGAIYDYDSLVAARQLPNSLKALAYNGVITSNFLVEGELSQKKFAFINSGAPTTDIILGTLLLDSNARWNSPTFCGVCTPEERNNDSAVIKGSYYLNTKSLGTHNVVAGGEDYSETRLVNNHQSGSDFRLTTTGTAIFLPGDPTPYPKVDASSTLRWQPIFVESTGSHLKTKSAFVNDKWELNSHWNFNIGVRYDKNNARDASGNLVSDDSNFSPRLGAIWDLKGDGRSRVSAGYAVYSTKIVDGNVGGAGNAAGTPATFAWAYGGPAINTAGGPLVAPHDALRMVFDWFAKNCNPTPTQCGVNSLNTTSVSYPGYSTVVLSPIKTPNVRELSLGFGQQIGRSGFARVDLIDRRWRDFYAVELDTTTGRVTQNDPPPPPNAPAVPAGDRAVLVNDNTFSKRAYEGVQLNFGWQPGHWNMGGGYTWSKLYGNDTTESDLSASSPLQPPNLWYPEFFGYSQYSPSGYLYGDQRHRAKVWAGYDFLMPAGRLNASVIQSADSGRAYSAIGTIDVTARNANFKYTGAPVNPNNYYLLSQIGTSHSYYFSKRGEFRTPSVFSTDLALNYDLPAFAKTTVFLQGQVLNVLNKSKLNNIVLGQLDTTVKTSRTDPQAGLKAFNPFTDTPIECPKGAAAADCKAMGANWQKADTFGQGLSKDAFQTPRTYRFAVGLRF